MPHRADLKTMVNMKGLEVDAYSGMRAFPLRSNDDQSRSWRFTRMHGNEAQTASQPGHFENLQLDSDDDELLLDWQQYSTSRHTCCCLDWSWLLDRLPFIPFVPPEWWYRLSRKNRKIVKSFCVVTVFLLGFGIFLAIPLSITESQDRKSELDLAPAPDLPHWHNYDDSCRWTDFYLPSGRVKPLSYDLHLNLTLQAPYIVQGHARIEVDILVQSHCVVLNAVDMNVTQIDGAFGKQQQKGAVVFNKANQTAKLVFKHVLPKGRGILDLDFSYVLEDGLNGFYRSSYQDGGETKMIAVTMFETVFARKAFPCFDEPQYKSIFNMSLTVPPKLTALANMPLVHKIRSPDGHVTWRFQPSPPMSPYLVAFAAGQLVAQKGTCDTMAGHTDVGVWGTPPRAQQLRAAVDMACASLKTYEQLLQVPFPLPKLDLLGVPDFGAGAMENWGLITYVERDLLMDPNADSVITENNVAMTVAHEIAHHWFGDLVTCDNWTELWLNEGFATYFEYSGADAYDSDFSNLDRFYAEIVSQALNNDAQHSSHPLSVMTRLTKLTDADNYFDKIMYEKGGSVLRMLRAWMNRSTLTQVGKPRMIRASGRKLAGSYQVEGRRHLPGKYLVEPSRSLVDDSESAPEEGAPVVGQTEPKQVGEPRDAFMAGLHGYLETYKYTTTGYADLWTAMGNATGQPVLEWMKTWTLRSGHPLLNVVWNAADGVLTIGQVPFSLANDTEVNGVVACDDTQPLGSWWIPLSYKLQGDDSVIWLNFNSCSLSIPLGSSFGPNTGFILLNPGRYGFYRINYPAPLWTALSGAASEPDSIQEVDLAGLLDDSFRLAEIGQLNITVFLDLTKAIGARVQAPEWSVWHTTSKLLMKLAHLLASSQDKASGQDCYQLMSTYITSKLTGPVLQSYQPPGLLSPLGINFTVQPNESLSLRLLRQEVLMMAGLYGDQQYSNKAWILLQGSRGAAGAPLHADVREVVYKLAVGTDVPKAWDTVRELYSKAVDAAEEYRLMKALTAANSPTIIQKSLFLLLDSQGVKAADIGRYLQVLGKHSGISFNMTWEFLFQHFDRLVERSGDNAAYALGQSSMDLASLFTDPQQWPRIEAFALKWKDILPTQFVNATRENIRQNLFWLQAHRKQACDWFAQNT